MKRLIIIGAGPGGYECAVRAARHGLDVHIIDHAGHLGGTCLNEGCIPTKCLCRTAEVAETVRQASQYGVDVPDKSESIDFHAAILRKNGVVDKLRDGIRTLLQMPGITMHDGYARFENGNPHTIRVGTECMTADYVIIATGSLPKPLDIPGADTPGVLNSAEMLDITEIPKRLCVIGGGVIGLEFASIFNSLGSEVCVLEYCKEILPNFDKDIAKRLRTAMKKKGVTFFTGTPVTAIHADSTRNGELHVSYEHRNSVHDRLADCVLMAVGRTANVESLNLAEAGIKFNTHGIETDDNMMTNVAGVYAVGDVNGRCQLAHAATAQSFRALAHILGEEDPTDLNVMPAAVFTDPEAAMVGLTEEQAESAIGQTTVHKAFYRANGRALSMGAEADGLVKIIADKHGRLIGGHILGPHAEELIHEISLAMNMRATITQLSHSIHAHPTLSELLATAADS